MPKRSTAGAFGYRYGFNGKENDNDVKGLGNQQDYGMRIYDNRLGRFLSTDPLATSYPFYSPYHFAGNSPVANVDLDGGEPQSYIKDWIPKPMFDLKTRKILTENSGFSTTVDDPELGYVDVEFVYDTWTKQNWFVHRGNNGQYYYLKNENGNHGELTLKGGSIQVKAGHFEPFETQDALQAKLGGQVADAIGLSVVGTLASFAVIEALPTLAVASWELWVGAHHIPEFITYFSILGGMSSVGLKGGAPATGEPENLRPTIEQQMIPDEVGPSAPRGPAEPYNRRKHYGDTPTKSDRKAVGAQKGEVVDHKRSLVEPYYEGDGKGGKPGYEQTSAERRQFANDRSNMQRQKRSDSNKQGGEKSKYSRDKKKQHGFK